MGQIQAESRRINASQLGTFMAQLLSLVGLTPGDAELVADTLVESNLRGIDSHGVARLPHHLRRIEAGSIVPRPEFRFEKLPGVGRRSAERMAYHLLTASAAEAGALAQAIQDVKSKLRPCAECGDLTEEDQCAVCADPERDGALVCIVEWPRDVRAIEKSAAYRGRYHVLMGRVSPLAGVALEDLRLTPLLARLRQ